MKSKINFSTQMNLLEQRINRLRHLSFFTLTISFFILLLSRIEPGIFGFWSPNNNKGFKSLEQQFQNDSQQPISRDVPSIINPNSYRKIIDSIEYNTALKNLNNEITRLILVKMQLQTYRIINKQKVELAAASFDYDCKSKIDSLQQENASLRKKNPATRRTKQVIWAF